MPYLPTETQTVSLAKAGRILGYRDSTTTLRLIANGQLLAFRAETPSGRGAWRVSLASIDQLLAGGRRHDRISDNPDHSLSGINSMAQQ